MFREAVKVNRSCVLFPKAQVGEDKVQSQEAASVRGDLKDPTRQTPTESLPGTSSPQVVKKAPYPISEWVEKRDSSRNCL